MGVELQSESTSLADELRESFAEASESPEPVAPKELPSEPEAKQETKERDTTGRFKQKENVEAAEATPGEAKPAKPTTPFLPPQPTPPRPQPTAIEVKPPQSWSPTAREKWTAIPPEIQQEVSKRERETSIALKEAAEAKRTAQTFRETVAPYEGMIRAEGSEPIVAVQNLLQAAMALRTAPPPHKAKMVADIVRTYGVDIQMLDQALAGQAPQGQSVPEYKDPRVDHLLAQLQQVEQQRTHSIKQQSHSEVGSFASTHEFMEPLEEGQEAEPGSIRDTMAQLLEMDSQTGKARMQRGQTHVAMTLEQAYDKACLMHPEISEVLKQRREAGRAANASASTQRAKNAASSVKSQPTGGPVSPEPDSIADTIRASIVSLSGR